MLKNKPEKKTLWLFVLKRLERLMKILASLKLNKQQKSHREGGFFESV
jgi:hypothetical protein